MNTLSTLINNYGGVVWLLSLWLTVGSWLVFFMLSFAPKKSAVGQMKRQILVVICVTTIIYGYMTVVMAVFLFALQIVDVAKLLELKTLFYLGSLTGVFIVFGTFIRFSYIESVARLQKAS